MAIKNRTAFFILVFIIGLNRFRPDFLARFPLELRVPLTLKIPLPFFLWKWSFRPRPTAIPGLRIYAGGHCIKKEGSAARHGNCGEDSYFISLGKKGLKSKSVLAVADGVGGWATHGGDSSGVSNGMMKAMKKFHLDSPFFDSLTDLVDKAFQYLVSSAQLSMGSTTICAASFDPDTGILDITNIGDSQLIVVRNGAVALEIPPGTFAFNAPFQIGFGMYGEPQGEIKEQSIEKSLSLDRGDLVIIATDGLFDNVYLEDICKAVISSQEQIDTAAKADSPESAASALKRIAKKLALKAQRQGNDPAYFSPFAKEAIESGNAPDYYIGGKNDDIAIIVALVA